MLPGWRFDDVACQSIVVDLWLSIFGEDHFENKDFAVPDSLELMNNRLDDNFEASYKSLPSRRTLTLVDLYALASRGASLACSAGSGGESRTVLVPTPSRLVFG